MAACKEWEANDVVVKGSSPNKYWYEGSYSNKINSYKRTSRQCGVEEETNQFLGKLNKVIEEGKFVYEGNEGEWKVVKNFRY